MLFIDNRNITDPRINLAIEEYALRYLDSSDSFLLFYINEPSVIIGKHQNTAEEINSDFIEERSIHVVRRLSGGGAVYHDLGNLNFSFITQYDPKRYNNYAEFTGPVIEVLRGLGVNAELSGRNDIVVEGRKISGNAQFTSRDRMFSHGTLLLDSNLDDVVAALRVKAGKIESKGIKSIRSRVANISEFLAEPMPIEEFRRVLLEGIFGGKPTEYVLTDDDWRRINELAARKYRLWEWNYGLSPAFNVQRAKRFPIGEIDVRINVADGRIRNIRFTGDFFANGEIGELEEVLRDIRYEPEEIESALARTGLEQYLADITPGELRELMY
jgi:lipoate-protein ligase A